MTTKHTKGPWRTGDAGVTVFGPPNGKPSPKTIARLPKISAPCNVSDLDENIANVHLISAAPELLCLLERLLDGVLCLPELPGTLCPLDIEQARAAIAKATGGAK